jgi:hypothetical protein
LLRGSGCGEAPALPEPEPFKEQPLGHGAGLAVRQLAFLIDQKGGDGFNFELPGDGNVVGDIDHDNKDHSRVPLYPDPNIITRLHRGAVKIDWPGPASPMPAGNPEALSATPIPVFRL